MDSRGRAVVAECARYISSTRFSQSGRIRDTRKKGGAETVHQSKNKGGGSRFFRGRRFERKPGAHATTSYGTAFAYTSVCTLEKYEL